MLSWANSRISAGIGCKSGQLLSWKFHEEPWKQDSKPTSSLHTSEAQGRPSYLRSPRLACWSLFPLSTSPIELKESIVTVCFLLHVTYIQVEKIEASPAWIQNTQRTITLSFLLKGSMCRTVAPNKHIGLLQTRTMPHIDILLYPFPFDAA